MTMPYGLCVCVLVLVLVQTVNTHVPGHLSSPGSFMQRSHLYALGRGHMAPMRPTPPTWGALVPLTVRQISMICGTCVGTGFWRRNRSEARLIHPQVQNGEQVAELEGGKMAEAITFGVFDQIRCCKSPARGFWTF